MQKTLTGKSVKKYYCIHCSWIGYNVVEKGIFHLCPKCDWVCYDEKEAKGSRGVYAVLDRKLGEENGS